MFLEETVLGVLFTDLLTSLLKFIEASMKESYETRLRSDSHFCIVFVSILGSFHSSLRML